MSLGISVCFAQEIPYTMVRSNPIAVNPAFTGVDPGYRVGVSYRNQWTNLPNASLPGSFGRGSVFVDGRHGFGNAPNFEWGWGGMVSSQAKGEVFYKENRFLGSASLIYKGSETYSSLPPFSLAGGFSYSYNRLSVDPNALVFSDQINPFDQTILGQSNGFPQEFIQARPFHSVNAGVLLRIPLEFASSPRDKRNAGGLDVSFSAGSILKQNISLLGQVNIVAPLNYSFSWTFTQKFREFGVRTSMFYQRARQRDLQQGQGRFNHLQSGLDIVLFPSNWPWKTNINRYTVAYPLAAGVAFNTPVGNNIITDGMRELINVRGVTALIFKVEASGIIAGSNVLTLGFSPEVALGGSGDEVFAPNGGANLEVYARITFLNARDLKKRTGGRKGNICPGVGWAQSMFNF